MHSHQPPQPPSRYGQQPPSGSWQQPPSGAYQQPGSPQYQPQDLAPYQQQSPTPYQQQGYQPQPPYRPARLDSEEVVLAAPMSFTGSAERLWKLTRSAPANALASAAVYAGVILLIIVAWAAVLCWYFFFGIWLVPYRLIRRGQRKRRRKDLRHREMLTMMHQMGGGQPPARSRGQLPPGY